MKTKFEDSLALIRLAKEKHGDRILYACSLSPQGMVLIDLLSKHQIHLPIVTIDTGRLPEATYDLLDTLKHRYGSMIEVLFPHAHEVRAMVELEGVNLFRRSVELRKRCCFVRKVSPLTERLKGVDAWITGRRKDQSHARAQIAAVETDPVHGLIKYNPMRDWLEAEVWAYIKQHNLPYNRLHDAFYPSIGCAPCTRAVTMGEDPRSGRWWWEHDDTVSECGLHVSSLTKAD